MNRVTEMNGKAIEAGRRSPAGAALSPESKGREIVAEIVNSVIQLAMFGDAEKHSAETEQQAANPSGGQ